MNREISAKESTVRIVQLLLLPMVILKDDFCFTRIFHINRRAEWKIFMCEEYDDGKSN